MAGVKGRSGRRPKPVMAHILAGTFRPDRHGPRPATVGATALQPPAAVPPVPKALVAGLRERGLQFVLNHWADYEDWSTAKLVVLHELGMLVDTLGDYEAAIAADGIMVTTPRGRGRKVPHPLLRVQAQAQRTFVLLLAKLDLKEK